MSTSSERRERKNIAIEPELYGRIESAAEAQNQSVSEYADTVLRRGLNAVSKADELIVLPLTPEERELGLRAAAEMERLGDELLRRRGGKLLSPPWELINEERDRRIRELTQDE